MYKNDENRWLGITDHLVIDIIDTFVLDFGYDKKTVEKIFYKKHKLNDFDDLTSKEVIEIEDEVKNALGITESKKSSRKSMKESKKSARKSIKENKMILSFEAFKDICVEEIGYSYIGSFDEERGTYFVSVIDDKRADKFCKYLRDNYDCECTFWKITDPYDDDYGLYRVEVI